MSRGLCPWGKCLGGTCPGGGGDVLEPLRISVPFVSTIDGITLPQDCVEKTQC